MSNSTKASEKTRLTLISKGCPYCGSDDIGELVKEYYEEPSAEPEVTGYYCVSCGKTLVKVD